MEQKSENCSLKLGSLRGLTGERIWKRTVTSLSIRGLKHRSHQLPWLVPHSHYKLIVTGENRIFFFFLSKVIDLESQTKTHGKSKSLCKRLRLRYCQFLENLYGELKQKEECHASSCRRLPGTSHGMTIKQIL